MKKWIILDRDGTIIKEKDYLHDPDGAELTDGAADGLRTLSKLGYRFVVLTNQSGIGRGYFTEDEMNSVHLRVDEMLACAGVRVDGWFHCPHNPSDGCSCRKPATGLVGKAQAKLGFDASDIAFVMGDKESDVELAKALGALSVLLMTGYGAAEYARGVRGTLNCANICEAAAVIARGERAAASSDFSGELEDHMAAVDAMRALADDISGAAAMIISALRGGGRFFVCGNGGSAADAQHIAAELSGRYLAEREPLDATALSCNTSALTAIGNDYGFDRIFARQLEAHGRAGDVLLAISTSGNSANVLEAARSAKKLGISTIALTGADGGQLANKADASLRVPSNRTPRIQEMHILIGHALCGIVEKALCR